MRRLVIAVAASERMCGECPCQDADEHLAYCGVFRRPLAGTAPHMRLRECIEAEGPAIDPHSDALRRRPDQEPR